MILLIVQIQERFKFFVLLFGRYSLMSHSDFANLRMSQILSVFSIGTCHNFASLPLMCYLTWNKLRLLTFLVPWMLSLTNSWLQSWKGGRNTFPWTTRKSFISFLDRAQIAQSSIVWIFCSICEQIFTTSFIEI